MTESGSPTDAQENCVICGTENPEGASMLTFHHAKGLDSVLKSGYLCWSCRPLIHTVISGLSFDDCDSCGAPLTDSGRYHLLEYNEFELVLEHSNLCSECLGKRGGPE